MNALRRRPTYRDDELLLGMKTGEFSFIPDEFIPHTATLDEITQGKFVISFEYSIDESKGAIVPITTSSSLVLGKSSRKILNLFIDAASHEDLLYAVKVAKSLIQTKKIELRNLAIKRNYDMICEMLQSFHNEISKRPRYGDAPANQK